jgi:hypothetical protein
LKDTLGGATQNTIDERVAVHLRKIKKDNRQELIDLVNNTFNTTNAKNVNIFFGELHNELYDEYKSQIADCVKPEMQYDVLDSDIEERLSGSTDILCYISGWMLTKIQRLNMSGIQSETLSAFVRANATLKSETKPTMPSSIVDQCEKCNDALKRPSESWSSFCCLSEALFLVNLNAVQVLHHRGRVLQQITITAGKSDELREKFIARIPKEFGKKETLQIWKVYYLFIISTFGALKSGVVVKRIREARPANLTNQLATRAFAKVAVVKVKTR